jgi:hypothetical protein
MGEASMKARRSPGVLLPVLLAGLLAAAACTGVQEAPPQRQHYFDKTEVDLEYGRPEASARYHRPRGVQQYISDKTEVDLARPRTSPSASTDATVPLPAPPDTPSPAPLPGGGR